MKTCLLYKNLQIKEQSNNQGTAEQVPMQQIIFWTRKSVSHSRIRFIHFLITKIKGKKLTIHIQYNSQSNKRLYFLITKIKEKNINHTHTVQFSKQQNIVKIINSNLHIWSC